MRRPRIGITTRTSGSASPRARRYAEAVAAAGGEVVWLDPPALRRAGTPAAALARVDGLLFSGGDDIDPQYYGEEVDPLAGVEVDPERDAVELPLARAAWEAGVPVLGICRGIQTLNVALGGTLHQDLARAGLDVRLHRGDADVAHPVEVAAPSRLAALVGAGSRMVNSAHHQALKAVAGALVVTARAPDGVVEAVEAPDRPFVVAVQWHPERMLDADPRMAALFEALVDAAGRRR
ncbi:MAG: gamma-glutamyl-gamma-aminobutyrate hydrolase family protein [Armatimonadota bacterium]|nr:gamma-glutamyl-gamma-aminobutyrate hydrolase family protein [Armatimonadota bacterium]MDR7437616.1 gamma-glutamyl-gamma-aminobutyrate hydrolase family protein [Armatimonadota bacterium]MDR7472620.1 gamma-glutamyl-gamma-aminobutyrate hydrolase family protein [Armatimonadota bacterium]MDR7507479.1 gamma-glutamyl-gamma-aminobutyrate hydrolase family protein [Armatimonadota bacterium]MDR7510094.1 gamma-glutamyl-gamma-aminobutyrate hydrolase family protein [Armatimonadota bacterium]